MMGFMCYYGHVQNTSNLGEGNVYKSYFLGALVELPCWSVPVIISKLGRRYSVTITNVPCPPHTMSPGGRCWCSSL